MFNLGSMFNLGPAHPVVGKKSILVKSSAAEVFNFIGDGLFLNYPNGRRKYRNLNVSLWARKVGNDGKAGTRRSWPTLGIDVHITVYEPPNRLALAGVVEPYRCLYELQPQSREDVTELSFTFELLELKVFMRPFEQLVRSAIQDGAVRTVENIKRLVENGKSATAGRL